MNELSIRKAGKSLNNLETWMEVAPPPEGEAGWLAGAAAWEFARAFLGNGGQARVPDNLQKLLDSAPLLTGLRLQSLVPEYHVRLDEAPGGSQRLTGLAVGASREGRVAVALHARTDAGFGPVVEDQRKRGKPGSQWSSRMSRLAEEVAGRSLDELGALRADLLSMAAAAVRAAEGEKAVAALLVFQEFRPKLGRAHQLKEQSDDLDAFVAALGGKALRPGILAGPFRIPGGPELSATIPLWIGKAVTLL